LLLYIVSHSADGNFSKSEIAEFVFANKLPLVTIFTRESAPLIFESTIKKQVWIHIALFWTSECKYAVSNSVLI
jgi:hypothetical protein